MTVSTATGSTRSSSDSAERCGPIRRPSGHCGTAWSRSNGRAGAPGCSAGRTSICRCTRRTNWSAPRKALELVEALRDADAVVVGSPGYHGAVSGLVKNALDYIEDLREDPRVYLDNTPWGCISCAYGWQAAVGTLGQLRSIGHALRAWPTPLGVAINSADKIWGPQANSTDTDRCAASSTCWPPRCCTFAQDRDGKPRERSQREDRSGRRPRHRLSRGGTGRSGRSAARRRVRRQRGARLGDTTSARSPERHRVLAPDMLGFGESAKVIDFNDGRGMRIRHIARFCEVLGVESAHFVGNSMGAVNLFVDATSESPVLPVRSLVMICGGGEIQRNEHSAALYDYDATLEGMRRIVEALFYDPVLCGRRRLCAAAIRVEHRARRVGSVGGGAGSAGPAWSRRRCRRARGPTSASACRRWWSRAAATNCCRGAGPPRSPRRSPAPVRR